MLSRDYRPEARSLNCGTEPLLLAPANAPSLISSESGALPSLGGGDMITPGSKLTPRIILSKG
eukprot:399229-Pleurochrysis_carterae.AAC.1